MSIQSTFPWDTPSVPKGATCIVGTSLAGHTLEDCDFLCDGTNDKTQIIAATQSLPAEGGEVFFLGGTYTLDYPGPTFRDNITFRGVGTNTIIKTPIWQPTTLGAGFRVCDLKFELSNSLQCTAGGYFSNVTFEVLWGKASNVSALRLYSAGMVENCVFKTPSELNNLNPSLGIDVQGANAIIRGNRVSGFDCGIYFSTKATGIVANNILTDCHTGIWITQSHDVCVFNNHILRGLGNASSYPDDEAPIKVDWAYNNLVINNVTLGKEPTNENPRTSLGHNIFYGNVVDYAENPFIPKPITFTGAVTAEYDGKTALTVDIPVAPSLPASNFANIQTGIAYELPYKIDGEKVYLLKIDWDSVTGYLSGPTRMAVKTLPAECGTIKSTVEIKGIMNVPLSDGTFNRVTLPSVNPAGLEYGVALYTKSTNQIVLEVGRDRSNCSAHVFLTYIADTAPTKTEKLYPDYMYTE